MTILNKEARRSMVFRMLNHRFSPEVKKLQIEYAELADRAYGKYVACYAKHLNVLPTGWFVTSKRIQHDVPLPHFMGYTKWGVGHRRMYANLEMSKVQKLPCGVHGGTAILFDEKTTEGKRLLELAALEISLIKQQHELGDEIAKELESLKTTKLIVEHWPAAVPFLPEEVKKTFLPAIPVKQLNVKLGLT